MASNFNFPEGSELKTAFRLGVLLSLMFLFTGCFMGELSGRSGESFTSPKPYMSYRHKNGMTEEGWRADWVACGGRSDGSVTPDSRFPGEKDDFAAMDRTYRRLKACMNSKGYLYSAN